MVAPQAFANMRQIRHVILLKILVEMFRTGSSVCSRYKMCKLRSCCSQTRAPVPKSEMNRAQPCNDHSHNHNTLHIVPEKAQSSGKYTMEGCPQLIDQKGTQEKSHHCKGAKTLYSKRQTGKLSKF